MPSRLLHSGQVVIDLVVQADSLPPPGGDVLARSARFEAGGGFNVMAAARRAGMETLYLGRHGAGRFGAMAREAMIREGIVCLLPPSQIADTGVVVALTDAAGERSFITCVGVEGELDAEELAQIDVREDDCVYVCGYSLLYETKCKMLEDWIRDFPARTEVVFDPGPLAAAALLEEVKDLMARITLWSGNRAETLRFGGSLVLEEALPRLAVRLAPEARIVMRDGADGCWLYEKGALLHIPGFEVEAVDANGAGDAHVGTFLAGLAEGLAAPDAARRANAAAALSVTRHGPATAPSRAELEAFLVRTKQSPVP